MAEKVNLKVHFTGGAKPLELNLDNRSLVDHFKRWVQDDTTLKCRGIFMALDKGKEFVINYQNVAYIECSTK